MPLTDPASLSLSDFCANYRNWEFRPSHNHRSAPQVRVDGIADRSKLPL